MMAMLSKKIYFIVPMIALFIFISSTCVLAQNTRITKSGYLASMSEELLNKAVEYVVAKDNVALQKLMNTNMVFMLKGDMKVYIVDTKFFSGMVKIRPVGQTVEVWTLIEAVGK